MAVNAKNWQELKKPNALERKAGRRCAPQGDLRRRAARARLRHDARQLAAPRAAVVAPGRRRHLDQDRGRAARILEPRRRPRGRHRHRPQREADRAARWKARAPSGCSSRPPARAKSPPAQIATTGDIEVMNPDLVICHLDEGATLNMELTADIGKGYVPAAANRPADAPIGLIPVDALYSPGPPGRLQGREHPRRPGARLRQAHA